MRKQQRGWRGGDGGKGGVEAEEEPACVCVCVRVCACVVGVMGVRKTEVFIVSVLLLVLNQIKNIICLLLCMISLSC